ncbi:MAG: C40 family peptidase [Armatimonadetes bacterium]|nr:C40 family peptidase [Armatimonadota bacterium]
MRNTNPWAALTVAVPLLLATASASFAAPNEAQTPPQIQIEANQAIDDGTGSESMQDVSVVLTLDDGAVRSAAPSKTCKSAQNTPSAKNGALCNIRKVATRYLGTPYKWGGITPSAFDCSGFTRYVYSSLGVSIPRTARQQFKAGKPVKRNQLKTGDLVFFDMMKGYVSHVGLYLGNGVFIHASTPTTGVKFSNINTGAYKKCFVGARRFSYV